MTSPLWENDISFRAELDAEGARNMKIRLEFFESSVQHRTKLIEHSPARRQSRQCAENRGAWN